ncbi:hypothetical protein N7U66_02330 [Lacinutrix neustonica]|uniref:Uncharacterized protein n=1 Tax=Lacinutrix neustonica TaxID=2980107 RepID=A0A9E8MX88_9FLAO|nr:hypothetical protein [Lacinutrix neustonica]WAC02559.1 hypothetical protein N7U66_02330 [Lacinutrix neustonica]
MMSLLFLPRRLYFNYADLDMPQPDYAYYCEYETDAGGVNNYNKNHLKLDYRLDGGSPGTPNHRRVLYNLMRSGEYFKFLDVSLDGFIYEIISPECGNCTWFSSNIKPDFWED